MKPIYKHEIHIRFALILILLAVLTYSMMIVIEIRNNIDKIDILDRNAFMIEYGNKYTIYRFRNISSIDSLRVVNRANELNEQNPLNPVLLEFETLEVEDTVW